MLSNEFVVFISKKGRLYASASMVTQSCLQRMLKFWFSWLCGGLPWVFPTQQSRQASLPQKILLAPSVPLR